MNYEELVKLDIDTGQRLQERHEYYRVALVFTTLAFSIQTAPDAGVPIVSIFEVGAWLFLFSSGMLALSRMYHQPVIYAYSVEINTLNANLQDAMGFEKQGHTRLSSKLAAGEGGMASIDEYKIAHRKAIAERQAKSKTIERKTKLFAIAHRILFILGFMSLIASRSYQHMDGVLW